MNKFFLFFLMFINFAIASPKDNGADSVKIMWEAVLKQKEYIDSLTTKYEGLLRKNEIQNKTNKESIKKNHAIKENIEKYLRGEKSVDSTYASPTIFIFLAAVPFLLLFFFILYLRYKHNKEIKSMNESFHQYINNSKALVTQMVEELEKTTDEAVDKAKSRLKILELIIAEAGQTIKPLNEKKQNARSVQTHKPVFTPPRTSSPSSGPNLINRYKNNTNLNISHKPASKEGQVPSLQGGDKTSMILLLRKKGLSTAEIARRLNMGTGEVDLILNIYKKRNEL